MSTICGGSTFELFAWLCFILGVLFFIIMFGLYDSILSSIETQSPETYKKIMGGQKKSDIEQSIPGFGINFIAHAPVFSRFVIDIFFIKEIKKVNKYSNMFLFFFSGLFVLWGISLSFLIFFKIYCS